MPFEITRVDHLAIAAWRLDDRLRLYRDAIGLSVGETFVDAEQGFTGTMLTAPGLDIAFEVVEPHDEDSMVGRYLRHHGQGFHHLSLQVRDVASAVIALRAAGIEPFGYHETESGPEFFIHPRDSGGALIQVTEDRGPLRRGG